MAGAKKQVGDAQAALVETVAASLDPGLISQVRQSLSGTGLFRFAGSAGSLEKALDIVKDSPCRAAVLDHAPDCPEASLALEADIPLVVVGGQDSMGHNSAPFTFLDKNHLSPMLLQAALSHALEKHRLQKALRKAQQTALENREAATVRTWMESLLTMIGSAAHELNQPLTSLLGHIELLRMNQEDREKRDRFIARIDETGEKLAATVRKIQDIRHDYSIHDSAFPNGDTQLEVLYAGKVQSHFAHLRHILESFKNVRLLLGRDPAQGIPGECGVVLVEFSHDNPDWQAWAGQAAQSGKPVILSTEPGLEDAAFEAVIQGKAHHLIHAWPSPGDLLKSLSGACEQAYAGERRRTALERLSQMCMKDELTSMCTQTFFAKAVEREISRAEERGRTSSVVMASLDNREDILKDLGPRALLTMLHHLSALFRTQARREDLPAHCSPGQFGILLPGRNSLEAMQWCQELAGMAQEDPPLWFGKSVPLVLHFGIAGMKKSGETSALKWTERAEKALENAREKGPGAIVQG